jgi:hypothetical protein
MSRKKLTRGRPRTRALKSPNRCAPGLTYNQCDENDAYCNWVTTKVGSKQGSYCRKKTNKRRT